MAIKGKGRSRSRRVIAAPPRPSLMVRKPPVWKRTWVRVVAGLLVLAGIAVIFNSVLHSRSVKARRNRETVAVQKYVNLLRDAIPKDRSAVPPDLVVIFPSVATDLPKIGTDIKGSDAVKRGKEIADQATAASDALSSIPVSDVIPSEFQSVRDTFTDGQFLMSQGVGLYEQIGQLIQASTAFTKAGAQPLLDQAQALANKAGTLFDQGYGKVIRVAKSVGINVNIPFVPPPVAPGGNKTPTPTPSVTPTPTPSPTVTPTPSTSESPSPTASASPTESSSPSATPSG
jgi:cell division septation protein DedD